jgi:hypothetical protein
MYCSCDKNPTKLITCGEVFKQQLAFSKTLMVGEFLKSVNCIVKLNAAEKRTGFSPWNK